MLGAARAFQGGAPIQAMAEMESGLLFVKAISDGSSLAVLAASECDARQVSYEMTRLVGAVGELLTPPARAKLLRRNASLAEPVPAQVTAGGGGIVVPGDEGGDRGGQPGGLPVRSREPF